ncbi:MAG: hypothetical protein MJD61_16420 [Proteobacteria bacterium]|nr:hypothetical protein [Pseudomonadota bacterium]
MAASEGEAQRTQPLTAGQRLAAKKAAKAARKAAKRGITPAEVRKVGEGLFSARDWFHEHRTLLVATTLGVAAVGAGIVALEWHSRSSAGEATGTLARAVATSRVAIVQGHEDAGEASEEPTFASREARATEASKQYRGARQRAPDSPVGVWAALGEGRALLELGKAQEARRVFTWALGRADSPFEKRQALEGIGFSHECDEEFDEAAKRWDELAALAGGRYRALADYHRARVQSAKGDVQGALRTLTALVERLKKIGGSGDPAQGFTEAVLNPGLLAPAEDRLLELERSAATSQPITSGESGSAGQPAAASQVEPGTPPGSDAQE